MCEYKYTMRLPNAKYTMCDKFLDTPVKLT